MWNKCTKLCWTFLFVILLVAGTTGASSRSAQRARFIRGTSVALLTLPPDFSRFAGVWVAHGASLSLAKDGTATFEGRTYNWCGSGVAQPCDSIDANSMIHSGHHEQIHFSRIAGPIAYGTIIASNFHPLGLAVTIELQPDDTLLYASNTVIALLCGPNAPVGTCGA